MKNEMGRIDYETFEAMTLEGIRGSLQDNYQISVHTIEKENGVSYRGIRSIHSN